MKEWMQVKPNDQHLQAAKKKQSKLLGVLEVHLRYLRGRVNLVNCIERPYDLLEQFVIRSLLELIPPPNSKQIAILLGFEDDRFVSIVLERLQKDKYLIVSETGILYITQKLRDDFVLKRWVEEELRPGIEFRYEWISQTFLPQQIRPEVWEGARQIDSEIKVDIDEEANKFWSQNSFSTKANSNIRWERRDGEKDEMWESPLQVIIYEREQNRYEWEVFHPFMRLMEDQQQQLRSTVKALGIEEALLYLLESG